MNKGRGREAALRQGVERGGRVEREGGKGGKDRERECYNWH